MCEFQSLPCALEFARTILPEWSSCYELTVGMQIPITPVPVALEVAMSQAVLSLSLANSLKYVQGQNDLGGGLLSL